MQESRSIYQNTVNSTDIYSDIGDIVILGNFVSENFGKH